jgi:hypothetical protein
MSGTLKLGIMIIVAVVVGWFAIKLAIGLITGLLSLLVPLAIVAGVGLILYGLFSRKPLGGGGRMLP